MHTIAATSLLEFRELVTESGAAPDAILEAAGLDADDAGRSDRFIPLRAAIAAVEAAADITRTADFGRRLAKRRGIETVGPIGIAAQSAHTFADALNIFATFLSAHSPGVALTLRPSERDSVVLQFRFLLDPAPRQRQSIELALMSALQIFRTLLGPGYAPGRAHLPHSALTAPSDYVRDFGCSCRFVEAFAGFTLRTSDLRRPLRYDGPADDSALDYVRRIAPGAPASLPDSVAELVHALMPTGALGLELVASQLDLHPRALQRRLGGDGVSFEAIVDKARRDTAERVLRDTDVALSHLAHMLGYSEQSVLTRSCNRWFGCSPKAYRKLMADTP